MTKTIPAAAGRIAVRKRQCNRWNEKRRQIFLTSLTETANVRNSAGKAKMSLASAYELKRRDPAFAHAWGEALEIGFSELEMKLLREALEGSERVETVEEGEARTVKYVKTVRDSSSPTALRLLLSHREEVFAFREARERERPAGDEHDEAQMLARMNLVRDRLNAPDMAEAGGDTEGWDDETRDDRA